MCRETVVQPAEIDKHGLFPDQWIETGKIQMIFREHIITGLQRDIQPANGIGQKQPGTAQCRCQTDQSSDLPCRVSLIAVKPPLENQQIEACKFSVMHQTGMPGSTGPGQSGQLRVGQGLTLGELFRQTAEARPKNNRQLGLRGQPAFKPDHCCAYLCSLNHLLSNLSIRSVNSSG